MSVENVVTSELLPCFVRDTSAKPLISEKNVVSSFKFSLSVAKRAPEKDEDGDYVLQRKRTATILLEHSTSTEIRLVGLQIWRAALLLADFVIHSQSSFERKTVLELGSGVGLTSVVAAFFARHVISTDLNVGKVLNLLRSNIERNKKLLKGKVTVESLDFFNPNWSEKIVELMKDVDIIIAADVIYDNDVTEAFVKTITQILRIPPKKKLYLGMEKRYVFTLSDLDSVAPCFEHFKSCLERARSSPPFSQWKVTELTIDFPQFCDYERTKDLVLFEIAS